MEPHGWTPDDRATRAWSPARPGRLGLALETDRNGNLWAWWGEPAAGHDAGVLAARVPAGMLFVCNPTGVSHSGAEAATTSDCVIGVRALAAALADLSSV